MISASLLEILCCPETHQPLRVAEPVLLERLNHEIAQGTVKNRAGSAVKERLEDALLRADGQFIYPVRNQIPVLLVGEAISVPQNA